MTNRPPEKLPDPWLFDSESLLRELDRCRELVLEISIAHPHQTHFDINIAVNALWNLRENLRYLLALHREGQRAFAKQTAETKQNHQKKTATHAQLKIGQIRAYFTFKELVSLRSPGTLRADQSASACNRFTTEAAAFFWPPFEPVAFLPTRLG